MLDKIFNEDCLKTMSKINNNYVDLIITSPPFNVCTKRKGGPADSGKYDVYKDGLLEDDYISWTIDVFLEFERILKENRVILYNFGYSIDNPSLPYKLASEIMNKTNLEIVETIIWRKKSVIPHAASYNHLTRRWEFFWVFARKNENKTFKMFKKISSVNEKTGQKYYEIIDNIIEAKNNDGPNKLNKATFSTELITKLISLYGKKDDIIYDSFIGTGTTGLAAKEMNCYYIGSEISEKQCEFANNKINNKLKKLKLK